MTQLTDLRLTAQALFWRPVGVLLVALTMLPFLAGCGGGSSGVAPTLTQVSGTVTDLNGAAVVGATITLDNKSVTSSQFGTYRVSNVQVSGTKFSQFFTVTASATVNGRPWTGQNVIEILSTEQNISNVHVVVSDTALQGAISGNVRDAQSNILVGAKVFVSAGPYTNSANPPATFFSNLSSVMVITDNNGNFTVPALPPLTKYTVTASFAGLRNHTVNNVAVTANSTTNISFTLNDPGASSTVPSAGNFSVSSITAPTDVTRAANGGGLNALKNWIWQQRGLLKHRAADPSRVTRHSSVTRSTPSGSIVENDLFWDYDPTLDNVYGYDILRSTNDDTHFASIATQRDSLGDRFADVENALTPDVTYFYNVVRLDTINFPAGHEQTPTPFSESLATRPLGPISLNSPSFGANVGVVPTFQWNTVARATKYTVLVYDKFPTLQSDTDPNGVRPLWSSTPTNGSSLQYGGPALQSGQTYYWAVLGADDVNSAYTITALRSFHVP